jgi:hypothetical protein
VYNHPDDRCLFQYLYAEIQIFRHENNCCLLSPVLQNSQVYELASQKHLSCGDHQELSVFEEMSKLFLLKKLVPVEIRQHLV